LKKLDPPPKLRELPHIPILKDWGLMKWEIVFQSAMAFVVKKKPERQLVL